MAIFIAISVGVFFAEARLRTALYSLSLLFLLAVGLSAGLIYSELSKSEKRKLISVGLWSGLVFGILAIIQLIVATFESTGFGTLCAGCKANVFGFPRINLFAAEPQFFANSLLPAFFLALFQSKSRLAKFSLFFTTLAISLTFSRGGFLAIFIAITALFIIAFVKRIDTSFIRKNFQLSSLDYYSDSPYYSHQPTLDTPIHLSLHTIPSSVWSINYLSGKLRFRKNPSPKIHHQNPPKTFHQATILSSPLVSLKLPPTTDSALVT